MKISSPCWDPANPSRSMRRLADWFVEEARTTFLKDGTHVELFSGSGFSAAHRPQAAQGGLDRAGFGCHDRPHFVGQLAIARKDAQGILADFALAEKSAGRRVEVEAGLQNLLVESFAHVEVGEQEPALRVARFGALVQKPGWRAVAGEVQHLQQMLLGLPEIRQPIFRCAQDAQVEYLAQEFRIGRGIGFACRQVEALLDAG
jgi:hypothetical protein